MQLHPRATRHPPHGDARALLAKYVVYPALSNHVRMFLLVFCWYDAVNCNNFGFSVGAGAEQGEALALPVALPLALPLVQPQVVLQALHRQPQLHQCVR